MSLNFTLSPLRFDNCSAPVDLWRYFHDLKLVSPFESFKGEYPIAALRAVLENYLRAEKLDPSRSLLLQWLQDPRVEVAAVYHAELYCASSLCPFREWEGNSDIAGVGVSFSRSANMLTRMLTLSRCS
jgi:hypothetical protein